MGHIKANCPEKTVGTNSVERQEAVHFNCVGVSRGWSAPKKPSRATRPNITLGDFITKNTFQKFKEMEDKDEHESEGELMMIGITPPPKPEVVRKTKRLGAKAISMALHARICPCGDCEEPAIAGPALEACDRGVEGALVVPPDEVPTETPSGRNHQKGAMVVEVVKPAAAEVNMAEVPKYVALTVVLDSGAGAHVMNPKDCKGHPIRIRPHEGRRVFQDREWQLDQEPRSS